MGFAVNERKYTLVKFVIFDHKSILVAITGNEDLIRADFSLLTSEKIHGTSSSSGLASTPRRTRIVQVVHKSAVSDILCWFDTLRNYRGHFLGETFADKLFLISYGRNI